MDEREQVTTAINQMGYRVIFWNEPKNANGPDCVIQKDGGRPMTLEVKKLWRKAGSWSCSPVSPPRRQDDWIAIIFPTGYVLLEPMRDHLKCCAPTGARSIYL